MIALANPLDEVDRYIGGVISGEIVTGVWVRRAVERHVADLKRQRTEEFPYYFDKLEAEDACLFFPVAFKHAKSRWDGEPFELSGWQCFCNAVLLGWKRLDGTRRFRRAHVSVARKNGKTTWCAGLAILLGFADGEAGAEVYIGATKIDQARILFNDAEQMIRKSSTLTKHSKVLKDNISFPGSASFIRPLGSDKPYDGLNPHAVFFDEIHAWKELHRKFYDTMTTGSGARPQPLICTITTAGDEKSTIWAEETDYCKSILEGSAQDEKTFVYIAEIDDDDDPFDESCWAKANPNLGTSIGIEYLQEAAAEAKVKSTAKNKFLRYHCNRVVTSTERFIGLDEWDELEEPLSDWRDADAIASGVDLGGFDDLASYSQCARFLIGETEEEQPIYRFELRQKSFMYKTTERNLDEQPWLGWAGAGLLTVSKYVIQDLRDSLIKDCEEFGGKDIAYDQHFAMQLAGDLEQEGLEPIKMPQNYYHFNEPIRLFQDAIAEGRIRHDGDPVLRWCVSNAVIAKDKADRWMFDKASSKEKIDPLVASVMAFRACLVAKSRSTGSIFII